MYFSKPFKLSFYPIFKLLLFSIFLIHNCRVLKGKRESGFRRLYPYFIMLTAAASPVSSFTLSKATDSHIASDVISAPVIVYILISIRRTNCICISLPCPNQFIITREILTSITMIGRPFLFRLNLTFG